MKYLACDFGGSSVKYALVNDNADISNSGKLPAPLDSKKQFVETVGMLYEQFANEIDGIAISIPGNVDPDTGYLFGNGVYTDLYGNSIIELLKARCPVRTAVENDGKCGALSEAWKGALADCNDGAVIILGSGIAGGLIKDKKIHGGKRFNAGEFSFALTNPGDRSLFACGFMNAAMLGMTYKMCKAKNLDLNIQDSSPALKMFDDMFAGRYPETAEEPQKIKADGRQMFKWLEEGDRDVRKIYYEFINSLSVLVFNVQICYAPEKIVIGGGLSVHERIFHDLETELNRYYTAIGIMPEMRSKIVRSAFLDECNLIGATYNLMLRK